MVAAFLTAIDVAPDTCTAFDTSSNASASA